MVNTFLISPSFSASVHCLDDKRLGKQRVEAYQLLKAIYIAQGLCSYFNDHVTVYPNNTEPHYGTPTSSVIPCVIDTDLKADISRWIQRYKQQERTLYLTDDWQITEEYNGYPLKVSHCNHSAVRMWFFSHRALCEYLNACIREWIARGKNNTMQLWDIGDEPVTYPWWLNSPDIYKAYCESLRNKDPNYYSFLPQGELSCEWPEDSPTLRLEYTDIVFSLLC